MRVGSLVEVPHINRTKVGIIVTWDKENFSCLIREILLYPAEGRSGICMAHHIFMAMVWELRVIKE